MMPGVTRDRISHAAAGEGDRYVELVDTGAMASTTSKD